MARQAGRGSAWQARGSPIRFVSGFCFFRHMVATGMIENGTPLGVVEGMMGTSTQQLAHHYNHAVNRNMRAQVRFSTPAVPAE
jgi:site-specific recombinase XerD